MAATAQTQPQFVRRTTLTAREYRKNFHQVDADVILAVTSPEADRVTPLMSKVYLRLVSAPAEFWEGPGVLYFTAGGEQGRALKASKVLYEVLGVASATAHKALGWMHERGIIGYFSGKNGVGIRIFLNRAAGSIGVRSTAAGEKILPFARGSNGAGRGSRNEPAFNVPSGDLEVLEIDINPDAPKSGAERELVSNSSPEPSATPTSATPAARDTDPRSRAEQAAPAAPAQTIRVEELYRRLKAELEPRVAEVAAHSAARAAQREMEGARVWFESKALPKAVRVAQRETYELARKLARAGQGCLQARVDSEVGRRSEPFGAGTARRLTDVEVRETAEVCVALFEAQGKAVEATLGEIGAEGGGWVPAEDVARVRAEVEIVLRGVKGEGSHDDGR